MNRAGVSPVVLRALDVAEKHLGIEELGRRLGVTAPGIQAWRLGHEEILDRKFWMPVDMLIELEPDAMVRKPKPVSTTRPRASPDSSPFAA